MTCGQPCRHKSVEQHYEDIIGTVDFQRKALAAELRNAGYRLRFIHQALVERGISLDVPAGDYERAKHIRYGADAQPCAECGGTGGHAEPYQDGDYLKNRWVECGACRG